MLYLEEIKKEADWSREARSAGVPVTQAMDRVARHWADQHKVDNIRAHRPSRYPNEYCPDRVKDKYNRRR